MKAFLDDKLVKTFPLLYVDRNAPMNETCMCWGFPGDGWFDLIWELSSKLEPIIQKFIKDNPDSDYPKAVQVKEKFGGLKLYMSFYIEKMYKLISETEKQSLKTCEFCGKPGESRSSRWIRTLCDDCHVNVLRADRAEGMS